MWLLDLRLASFLIWVFEAVCFFDSAICDQLLHPLASNDDCMIRNDFEGKCASPGKTDRSIATMFVGWHASAPSSIRIVLVAVNRGEIGVP